jgi:hypothetical protein
MGSQEYAAGLLGMLSRRGSLKTPEADASDHVVPRPLMPLSLAGLFLALEAVDDLGPLLISLRAGMPLRVYQGLRILQVHVLPDDWALWQFRQRWEKGRLTAQVRVAARASVLGSRMQAKRLGPLSRPASHLDELY